MAGGGVKNTSTGKCIWDTKKEKDYGMYEIFYKNLIVTIKQKFRAKTWNEQKKKQKKVIRNHPIKVTDKNTRGKRQWRYRATRK